MDGRSEWQGKTMLWLGTSIPEGRDTALGSAGEGRSYPEMVGEILGATIVNLSLGSSMCRANVRTGDYYDGSSHNILRALMQTREEKEDMIAHWEVYRRRLRDPDTYPELESVRELVLGASFEIRLLPWLDGTRPMPDLFVIDHGHNDYKYKLPDGRMDIELEPVVENIRSGLLAEDIFMTANGNENLVKYMGDLSRIPKRDKFIASLNRNCFIGAVNFLCTLILVHNPRAKIVFIGNLDNFEREGVVSAQRTCAHSWHFPLYEVWKVLGFGGHYIPGTAQYWGTDNPEDFRQKQIYCRDNTHPHSDSTGESLRRYAQVIAAGLRDYPAGL